MNRTRVPGIHQPMWPFYPDLLERPVPRYTSFPTAAAFSDAVGEADLNSGLRALTGEVSLYLHIPYCEQICWYCGCNTGAANRAQRLSGYLDALHREIALIGARFNRQVAVRRVAFGGGSPNAITPTDFLRLLDALTRSCQSDANSSPLDGVCALAGGLQAASCCHPANAAERRSL